MGVGYPRVKEIIQQVLGSGLIYLNSHADDWKNPDIEPYLNQYVRGSNGITAIDRVQLLKLLWDAVGTEFGGRHELYERNYGGDHEAVRFQTLFAYQGSGPGSRAQGLRRTMHVGVRRRRLDATRSDQQRRSADLADPTMTATTPPTDDPDLSVTPLHMRKALGRFASGVTIVPAESEDEAAVHGMTANAFTSVSLVRRWFWCPSPAARR